MVLIYSAYCVPEDIYNVIATQWFKLQVGMRFNSRLSSYINNQKLYRVAVCGRKMLILEYLLLDGNDSYEMVQTASRCDV